MMLSCFVKWLVSHCTEQSAQFCYISMIKRSLFGAPLLPPHFIEQEINLPEILLKRWMAV